MAPTLGLVLAIGVVTSVSLGGAAQADTERVQNPANMHWYQRIDTPLGWRAAGEDCASRRAHLVTVTSASENAFVYAIARTSWLGGTDRGGEKTWRWVSGEQWHYTNWAVDQPDNGAARRGTGPGEYYLAFAPGGNGRWTDAPDRLSPFVCEWDLPYVAMGDSYSSGEGSPPFDPGTDSGLDRCHRSAYAWPRLVGSVRLVACSGAPLSALSQPYAHEPPQLTQLTARLAAEPGPSLVTITIGGNDVHFAEILARCVLSDCADAVRLAESRIAGPDGLTAGLTRAYRAIMAAVPRAQLVVVGYPNIVPTAESTLAGCDWLSPAERASLVDLATALDAAARTAAGKVPAGYVSTLRALSGHELCTADSWMYPIGLAGGQNRGHPTAMGQRAIAATVGPYLDDLR